VGAPGLVFETWNIAQAETDSDEIAIHMIFSGPGQSASWTLPFSGYTIKSKGKLSFLQAQGGGVVGGIQPRAGCSTTLRATSRPTAATNISTMRTGRFARSTT
jgi:hypothetical protein